MCGIAGIIDYSGVGERELANLKQMNRKLRHRGPDGEGYFHDSVACFGHRRLAIIDIPGGRQPMSNRDGESVIVFNGEIYNFPELKAELMELGHHFETHSDTEVLLHSFKQWGKDCLARLNGDFAFAIWDAQSRELFLARDRLGVKPLYYATPNGRFVFASETKALLEAEGISNRMDPHGLVELLSYFQPLAPRTIYEDISSLEPGHYLVCNSKGITKRKYWDIEFRGIQDPKDEQAEALLQILTESTKMRMVSDVPIGGFLSGGLDSSVVCGIMAEHGPAVKTFSADYPGNSHSNVKSSGSLMAGHDAWYADLMSSRIGSDHTLCSLGPLDFFHSIPELSAFRDLPAALGSEVGLWQLCRVIKKSGASVALSGEGADEACLGYYFFIQEILKRKDGRINPFFMNKLNRLKFMINREFSREFKPLEYIEEVIEERINTAPQLWEQEADRIPNLMHYLQLKVTLPYLLDRSDRLGMAESVEIRVPFCDHRFVEFYFNLPVEKKFTPGREKNFLRDACRELIPKEIAERKKSIFPYSVGREVKKHLLDKVVSRELDPGIEQVFDRRRFGFFQFAANIGLVPEVGSHLMSSLIIGLSSLMDSGTLGNSEHPGDANLT